MRVYVCVRVRMSVYGSMSVCVCISVCVCPPIAKGMSPFLSETSGTHQGVVEDLPEVRVQMVSVIAGSGQEAAEFVLIAQVEEDALELGDGCEEMRVAASQHPGFGRLDPTHLVPQALTEGHVWVRVAAREHLPLGQLCPQGLATDYVCLGYIGHIPHAPGGTHTGVS